MVNQIIVHHQNEYGTPPSVICSAPGIIHLLGEHGACIDSPVLSFAVDRRTYIALSPREDHHLHFFSANLKERKKTTISGLKFKTEDRWANYAKGVIDALIKRADNPAGMDLTILSRIPMGIGLGSSSALTVAAACAVKTLLNLDISDQQTVAAAHASENNFMRLQVGISSPAAAYFARSRHLMVSDSSMERPEYLRFDPAGTALLITDSRVPPEMSADDRAQIERCRRECIRSLKLESGVRRTPKLSSESLSVSIDGLSERSRRVGLHLAVEEDRIGEFRRAVADESIETAGRVLFHSHESLRDLLEISCPELDWLAKRAVETDGVYGARMIGEGYGGCIITLVDDDSRQEYAHQLEEYDRIFGFKAELFPVNIDEGALTHAAGTAGTA